MRVNLLSQIQRKKRWLIFGVSLGVSLVIIGLMIVYRAQRNDIVPRSVTSDVLKKHAAPLRRQQVGALEQDGRHWILSQDTHGRILHEKIEGLNSVKHAGEISIQFNRVPMHFALDVLGEFIQQNIVASQDLSERLSINLHHVPWQQALATIVELHHLSLVHRGDIMVITRPSAHVTKNHEQLHTAFFQLRHAKSMDVSEILKDKSSSLLSSQGTVGADKRTNLLWVHDHAKRIQEIKGLIRHLDVPHQQVIIEARIVNMSKECAEELGVRFGVTQPGQFGGTLASANQLQQGVSPANIPVADRLNLNLAANPLEAVPATMAIALAHLGAHTMLDMELSALESQGRAEIVANPSLITTNQQPAMIESGEDIPYQESSLNGATTIAFKKAVLSLKVTPQMTPDGQLLLSLLINQDSDSGRRVQGVPVLLTKSITTQVVVRHGETIVLGGIYKKGRNRSHEQVPFLGNLPGLGHVFQHQQRRMHKEELLIFITPRVVE